jgi:tRNA-binding protein
MKTTISFEDFIKIDIRVGTILEVQEFPNARNPSYRLKIDFGPLGVKKSSAQITRRYKRSELQGLQVLAVVNFPEKQIANFMSQCLLLGAVDGDDVVLLRPEDKVANGTAVT